MLYLLFHFVAGSTDSGDESSDNSIKLSNNRYLTVTEFKNKVRVDVREYYINSDGERKPGKKGISLSLEEWQKIADNLDKIENAIKKAGGEEPDE